MDHINSYTTQLDAKAHELKTVVLNVTDKYNHIQETNQELSKELIHIKKYNRTLLNQLEDARKQYTQVILEKYSL
jgi:t-SNARE complex subunit (syntaxin)